MTKYQSHASFRYFFVDKRVNKVSTMLTNSWGESAGSLPSQVSASNSPHNSRKLTCEFAKHFPSSSLAVRLASANDPEEGASGNGAISTLPLAANLILARYRHARRHNATL